MDKNKFYKYQGTGNDFVLIDNRDLHFDSSDEELIESICHRRFGVGADGLMLLENSKSTAFTMRYYNSDGRESTMCGNGGRCIAAFAVHLAVAPMNSLFSFEAIDGQHDAIVNDEMVTLKMADVEDVKIMDEGLFLDTGSPHFIVFVENPQETDVFRDGEYWRNHDWFAPEGTNVNFVGPISNGKIEMRTFERGVEDETWSCGTGAVAAAIASAVRQGKDDSFVMHVPGGELMVNFNWQGNKFTDVWLKGPAKYVFKGIFLKEGENEF